MVFFRRTQSYYNIKGTICEDQRTLRRNRWAPKGLDGQEIVVFLYFSFSGLSQV